MSTRCQIGFYQPDNNRLLKPDALLYRHSNGYPGTVSGSECGVLPDLVPFLRLFYTRRGLDDIENAAAWTLHHLIDLHVTRQTQLREVSQCARDYLPEDGKDFPGFGVCQEFHGDIRFFYAIRGPILKVFEVHWHLQDDEPREKHFRLLTSLRLDREEHEEV
jgi:hypothetical protein